MGVSDINFKPLVSIVIPVYNGSNYMRQAIDSALAQTYGNFEIIVINDGSRDNGLTSQIARSYGDKIRYFEKENGGVATALNRGIEEMRGDYFSWLSHDDLYVQDKLLRQVQELAGVPPQDRQQTLVYSDWQLIDKNGVFGQRIRLLNQERTQRKLEIPLYPLVMGLIHGCALLVPANKLREVGGFDPTLRTANDYDCWLKILKLSKIKYIPESLVLSRIHAEQDSKKIGSHHGETDKVIGKVLDALTAESMKDMEGNVDAFMAKFTSFLKDNSLKQTLSKALEIWSSSDSQFQSTPLQFKTAVIIDSRGGGDLQKSMDSLDAQTYPIEKKYVFPEIDTDRIRRELSDHKIELVFFMRAGDVFIPGKIKEQIGAMSSSGNIWSLSASIVEENPRDLWSPILKDSGTHACYSGLAGRADSPLVTNLISEFGNPKIRDAKLNRLLHHSRGQEIFKPLTRAPLCNFTVESIGVGKMGSRLARRIYQQLRRIASGVYRRCFGLYFQKIGIDRRRVG